MKLRLILVCTFAAILANSAFAREATLFLYNHHRSSNVPGLYMSHLPSGRTEKITGKKVHWACLAPNAMQLGLVHNDSLYIINRDGTGLTLLCTANDFDGSFYDPSTTFAHETISWAETGIFWVAKYKIYRYDVTKRKLSVILNLRDLGSICTRKGDLPNTQIQTSRDGLTIAGREMTIIPKNKATANLTDHLIQTMAANGETIADYGCAGHKDLRAFLQFSPDFSSYNVVWGFQWGHGRGMTANGGVVLVEHGFHRNLMIYAPQEGTRVRTIHPWGRKYNPPYPAGFEGNLIIQTINNDSLLGAQGTTCYDRKYPKECSGEETRRAWYFNWVTDEYHGEFTLPHLSQWGGKQDLLRIKIWDGPLPALSDDPYISLSAGELTFTYDGKTPPSAQAVTVSNIGKGTLGKVSYAVSPSSANWLSVTVEGNGGNTQTISNGINVENLTSDNATATVTISGGGASNTASYTVSYYKGDLIAPPTELQVEATGDSLLDATLTWKDNAINETGYCIERKTEGGTYKEIAKISAGKTAYTDVRLEYHTKYFYRIRAYIQTGDTPLYSTYSAEQFVTIAGIAWVRIAYPAEGDVLLAGSKDAIRWEANNCGAAIIKLSTDDGVSWTEVTDKGGIEPAEPGWGNFEWTVPNVNVTTARLYIGAYPGNLDPFAVTGSFTISPDAMTVAQNTRTALDRRVQVLHSRDGLRLRLPDSQPYSIVIYSMDGSAIAQFNAKGATTYRLPGAVSKGTYIIQLEKDGSFVSRQQLLHY